MIAALAPPTRPVHAQMWRTLRVLLPESRGKGRGEGGREEQSFSELGLGKIDGALVLSGATGFIGSHILYQLLCVAEELGVSRIVLLVRGRHDADAASRVAALGRKALFDPVRGRFDRLVVPMEADLNVPMDMVKVPAQIGALVSDGTQPTGGYVRCLLHCAADVKFTQTLDEAGLSVITSSLQMADLAAALSSAAERCRLVVVSTIFAVSPAPTATPLPARLATLNGIDPRAIYDNMMSGTAADKWSEATRSAMGYANNYVFAKAVMEPLLKERAAALRVPTILSRPSIVGPAFAVPYAGWHPSTPSTILVGYQSLWFGVPGGVFNQQPLPIVPVDVFSFDLLRGLSSSAAPAVEATSTVQPTGTDFHVRNGSFDSLAACMFSSRDWASKVTTLSAAMGAISSSWCVYVVWASTRSPKLASALVYVCAELPARLLASAMGRLLATRRGRRWLGERRLRAGRKNTHGVSQLANMMRQGFKPFGAPTMPWQFQSNIPLPSGWCAERYLASCLRAGLACAAHTSSKPRLAEPAALDLLAGGVWADVTLLLSRAPTPTSLTNLVVRLGLRLLGLRVTVNLPALGRALALATAQPHDPSTDTDRPERPLVLLPTHRSFLDFILLALLFDSCPLLPPYVAARLSIVASEEFRRLPVLGRLFPRLGAVFVRRTPKGSAQRDASIPYAAQHIAVAPISVLFPEGTRSRDRRSVQPLAGFVNEVQHRCSARHGALLLPCAISYERIPEGETLAAETRGDQRSPLSSMGLFRFMMRAVTGRTPRLGSSHVAFGSAIPTPPIPCVGSTVGIGHDGLVDVAPAPQPGLYDALRAVQMQQVELLTVTALHVKAATHALRLPEQTLLHLPRDVGCQVDRSTLLRCALLDGGMPPFLAAGAAVIVAEAYAATVAATATTAASAHTDLAQGAESPPSAADPGASPPPLAPPTPPLAPPTPPLAPLQWRVSRGATKHDNTEAIGRWGFADSQLKVVHSRGAPQVAMSSDRYAPALGTTPLAGLWGFLEGRLGLGIRSASRPCEELQPSVHRGGLPAGRADLGATSRPCVI